MFFLIRDMLVSERERHKWHNDKTDSMAFGRICPQCMYDARIDENDYNDADTLMDEIERELMALKKGRTTQRVGAHKRALVQTDEEQKEARAHGMFNFMQEGTKKAYIKNKAEAAHGRTPLEVLRRRRLGQRVHQRKREDGGRTGVIQKDREA